MKNFCHTIVALTVLISFPVASFCQLPTITTSADKNTILIGEQINLTVQVTMPDSRYKLTWLTVPADFGAFVLASQDRIDSSYQTGVLKFRQQLHITSFDSGQHIIPPLAFQFDTFSGDSSFKMFTDSIRVDVRYSPEDDVLPFHDIKPIISVKKEESRWFWVVIIIAAVLIAIAIFLILRRKKKKVAGLFDSHLSDYDEAVQLIGELENENLPAKGEFKSYYLRLTDIFKRYISRNTLDNKMHLTGAETIAEITHRDVDKPLQSEFATCIRMADAVKFAKYKPSVEESKRCLTTVRNVIDKIHGEKKEEADDL